MNILIIEPDFILTKVYKKAFESAGFDVRSANNAQKAIKMIDKKKPSAIIIELQLGAHSGVEFLHEFRSYEDWQSVPLYVYSSVPFENFGHNKISINSLGVKRYFYKSKTSISQLVGIIASDLGA